MKKWTKTLNEASALVMRLVPAVLLSSCVAYSQSTLVGNPDRAADSHFVGIMSELNAKPVVNVLVVHGMGTHDNTYADGFLNSLRELGPLAVTSECSLADRFVNRYGSYSTVHRCVFHNFDGHELRVFVLTWSNLTELFENTLLAYDWQYYGSQRVLGDRSLKHGLVDTSFDDAVIYSGAFAPAMRDTVARAICVALTNKKRADLPCSGSNVVNPQTGNQVGSQPPMFVVTHSLGSAMVAETLGEMSDTRGLSAIHLDQAAGVARVFRQNLRAIYMLANQLPLLYLARIPPEPSAENWQVAPDVPSGPIRMFGDWIKGLRQRIDLVSFNDPNDLLTFPLPAGFGDRIAPGAGDTLRIVNVRITNAPYHWLGVIVNPDRAHTGYWTNDFVVRLILNGY